jgi:hypothetical protein
VSLQTRLHADPYISLPICPKCHRGITFRSQNRFKKFQISSQKQHFGGIFSTEAQWCQTVSLSIVALLIVTNNNEEWHLSMRRQKLHHGDHFMLIFGLVARFCSISFFVNDDKVITFVSPYQQELGTCIYTFPPLHPICIINTNNCTHCCLRTPSWHGRKQHWKHGRKQQSETWSETSVLRNNSQKQQS